MQECFGERIKKRMNLKVISIKNKGSGLHWGVCFTYFFMSPSLGGAGLMDKDLISFTVIDLHSPGSFGILTEA